MEHFKQLEALQRFQLFGPVSSQLPRFDACSISPASGRQGQSLSSKKKKRPNPLVIYGTAANLLNENDAVLRNLVIYLTRKEGDKEVVDPKITVDQNSITLLRGRELGVNISIAKDATAGSRSNPKAGLRNVVIKLDFGDKGEIEIGRLDNRFTVRRLGGKPPTLLQLCKKIPNIAVRDICIEEVKAGNKENAKIILQRAGIIK